MTENPLFVEELAAHRRTAAMPPPLTTPYVRGSARTDRDGYVGSFAWPIRPGVKFLDERLEIGGALA